MPSPLSPNAKLERAPGKDDRFDPTAKPDCFYFDVETAGGMEPGEIVQKGISILQEKLAAVIAGLDEDNSTNRSDVDDVAQDLDHVQLDDAA